MLRKFAPLVVLALLAAALGGNWYAGLPAPTRASTAPAMGAQASPPRTILYYRDPGGAPSWSATPRKDAQGRDFLPVFADEEISFDPNAAAKSAAKPGTGDAARAPERKIIYYRNPMGLPDTSPVPKKDSMGMDYIAVYDGEDRDDGTIAVSPAKIQRSGVRTAIVAAHRIGRTIRAVGAVALDERRLTVVTLRSEGYVERLFVNASGQAVRAGEPLFRVYSADIQRAQVDLLSAMRAMQRGISALDADRALEGAMQRLRNLGVPESRIREVRESASNPRTIDWPAPADGVVISKRIIEGQRVAAGEELYRIADLSHVWVIADIAESDIGSIAVGTRAEITFRAFPSAPVEGSVAFVYPEMRMETRTARARIELPNPDGRLRAEMYADVVFGADVDDAPVTAVPLDSVIDSGNRQVVLVAREGGRFEPRPVRLGQRGEGYVEILDGLRQGEEVVTRATFLLDAESNLRAALRAFTQAAPEAAK
ncbi:MAG: efflux RND transporter periplasmic adaptor subunit [Proteobacteria bacterium]|nr:efflux RND transporter periplasmic adaptor subunit [Pseudomonadota bacterium]